MPFWLGEAPARSDELSARSRACAPPSMPNCPGPRHRAAQASSSRRLACSKRATTCRAAAAEQIAGYLAEAKRSLGVVPTGDALVLERFFDESGGMQLVLHAPFGSRINHAWGLALRKQFCRQFNFELQAAATEEALMLSLGAAAFVSARRRLPLSAPEHRARRRWCRRSSTRRSSRRAGAGTRRSRSRCRAIAAARKVPPQLQRMHADDLLASVFPDAAACLENIPGAREIPDHPLVNQTVRDCLEEAMDFDGLERRAAADPCAASIACVARDTPEPSVLSHEILNSAVYTFLDDAPLEERRTHAVYTRRATEVRSADDLGALDPAAIERVRHEAWPIANTADEMYDALMVAGYIRESELDPGWPSLIEQLGERAVKKSATRGLRWSARTTRRWSSSRAEWKCWVRSARGNSAVRKSTLSCSPSRHRDGSCAAASRRAPPSSSGATAACSRASIATR